MDKLGPWIVVLCEFIAIHARSYFSQEGEDLGVYTKPPNF